MATADYTLEDLIPLDGAPRTAFFNGRLLSAEDLQREQALRAQADRRVARLVGCGVARGLEVVADGTTIAIGAGSGVAPSGELIEVGALTVRLGAAATADAAAGRFATCAGALGALRTPGAGFFVLVLTPGWRPSGRAATMLGEVGACNRDVDLPAVRVRLLPLALPGSAGWLAPQARNRVAHALARPGAAPLGWLPAAASSGGLGADDLPLAVVQLDAAGAVVACDGWSARRRLAPPPGGAGDALWPRSSAVAMEAFSLQFAAQLDETAARAAKAADDGWTARFAAAPPAALLSARAARWLEAAHGAKAGPARRRALLVAQAEAALAGPALDAARCSVELHRCSDDADRVLALFDGPAFGAVEGPDGGRGDRPGAGGGEFSSPRLASAAAKTLRRRDATENERRLAGSVLTQARDRKPRKG